MIIKLSYTAFLALVSTTATTNAFLSRGTHAKRSSTAQMVGGWDNEDFLAALSGTNSKAGDTKPEEEELEADQGGSMFKEILQKAKERVEPGPPPIMNPFLAAPNNPIPPIDPSEISVEEQARMYREMMKNNAAVPPAPMDIPPPGRRVARTDRAGKPVGRNRDADTIANTADLYFAQLKRDSSVRGFARLQGDEDYSNKVFADEGIKELETILVQNPYLTG